MHKARESRLFPIATLSRKSALSTLWGSSAWFHFSKTLLVCGFPTKRSFTTTYDMYSIAELCESLPSNRNLTYFTGESGTTPQGSGGTSTASLTSTFVFDCSREVVGCALLGSPVQLQQVSQAIPPGRAPP